MPVSSENRLKSAVTAENVERGMILTHAEEGKVRPMHDTTEPPVGIALTDAQAGEVVGITQTLLTHTVFDPITGKQTATGFPIRD